jgi:hypothetical protein
VDVAVMAQPAQMGNPPMIDIIGEIVPIAILLVTFWCMP